MTAAYPISPEHAAQIARESPRAVDALFAPQGGELGRLLTDVNFPRRAGSGALVGRATYQILFDRKLGRGAGQGPGGEDDDDGQRPHHVVNWLYCEWARARHTDGDRFIIASGTITSKLEVEVAVAAIGDVVDEKEVRFGKAGLIARSGSEFRKTGDLTEAELVSKLASFRSGILSGATIFSEDLDEE